MATNKIENVNFTTATLNMEGFSNWASSNYICPYCGSTNTEYDTTRILTSNPPQNRCRCKDCGENFFSGQCKSDWSNNDALNDFWKQDQSILNIPKIGDPTPGESPYWIPFTPDPFHLNPPYKKENYGWICPKCGRVMAPHMDSCKFCISSPYAAVPKTTVDSIDKNKFNSITSIPNQNTKLTCDADVMNYLTTSTSEMNDSNKGVIAISSVNSDGATPKSPLSEEMMQKFLNESESVFEAVDKYQEWENKQKGISSLIKEDIDD